MKLFKRMFMSYDDMMKDMLEENKHRMTEQQYQKQMDFVNSGKFTKLMLTVVGVAVVAAPIFRVMVNNHFDNQPNTVSVENVRY